MIMSLGVLKLQEISYNWVRSEWRHSMPQGGLTRQQIPICRHKKLALKLKDLFSHLGTHFTNKDFLEILFCSTLAPFIRAGGVFKHLKGLHPWHPNYHPSTSGKATREMKPWAMSTWSQRGDSVARGSWWCMITWFPFFTFFYRINV